MSDKPVLWYAGITNWTGVSVGATHWYVKLRGGGRTIDVEWVLDEERAAALTAKDDSFQWHSGEQTNRFDTREQALAAARAAWSWCSGDGVLIIGSWASCDPPRHPPLDGSDPYLFTAQEFYKCAAEVGWWEGDPVAFTPIADEWFAWVQSTFERDEDSYPPEVFTITGPPEDPENVWCKVR